MKVNPNNCRLLFSNNVNSKISIDKSHVENEFIKK